MRYAIKPGSEVYNRISEINSRMEKARELRKQVIRDHFAESEFISSSDWVGSISGVKLESKPEGWKLTSRKHPGYFYPKAANKKDLKLFEPLKPVRRHEIGNAIEFSPELLTGMVFFSHPGFENLGGAFIMSFPEESKYKPIEGLEPILESEYWKIKESLQKA